MKLNLNISHVCPLVLKHILLECSDFSQIFLSVIDENMLDNVVVRNIVSFIKETHFCHQLLCYLIFACLY